MLAGANFYCTDVRTFAEVYPQTIPLMIRNLLLDLGGVLLEIDFARTISALEQLKDPSLPPVHFHRDSQDEEFALLDIGAIDIDAFADKLIARHGLIPDREAVKAAWNALLVGPYAGRAEQLAQLKPHFSMALLSNTNLYHFETYKEMCAPMFSQLDHLFLSYEMGVRKPGSEIFLQALDTMGWKADETLFVDDAIVNIDGAKAAGLRTFHLDRHDQFDELVAFCLTEAGQ